MTNQEKIDKVKKAVNSIIFPITVGVLIFLKCILLYYNSIAIPQSLPIETVLGTIGFITIIVCILCLLTNRARVIASIIVDLLISLILFGDNVYYRYSNNVLSVSQITNLQYGDEIAGTIPELLKLSHILYFVDIILLIILVIHTKIEKRKIGSRAKLILRIVTFVVIVIGCIFVKKNYIDIASEKVYNKDQQIREATIFGYHIYDFENALNIKKKVKYKNYDEMIKAYNELKSEYETEYGETEKNLKGILEGKNVIVLQLESVQEFVLNKQINNTPITPNLNKFLAENIEISNMYMQSYSTTADSEHSTLTSLYPMENGMAFSKHYTNTYDDIFKIFKNANYHTSYVHGNDAYFWNRGNVYSRMAVDDIELKDKFDDTEYINGYLSDEIIYNQTIEKMKNYEKPFFSFIVSASSHTPFELEGLQDESKVTVDVGKYKDTYFGNYIEAVNYADYAFGVFIEKLKAEGLYDNTAIILYGDHNGLPMYDENMKDFLSYLDSDITDVDLKLNYARVLRGMKIPGIKSLKIEKPVSKVDIKPTLAYLCNIEDGFSLGTNMFNKKDFVILNNQRIITDKYYYDENWYDIESGKLIEISDENLGEKEREIKEKLDKYYSYMTRELEISNSVIINNLLKR